MGFVADPPSRAIVDEAQRMRALFAAIELAVDRQRARRHIGCGAALCAGEAGASLGGGLYAFQNDPGHGRGAGPARATRADCRPVY